MNLKTGALLLLVGSMGLLAACESVKREPVTATITEVFEDKSPMGCMGTNWNTTIRTEDGRVDKICGKFGARGDKIRGCWLSGGYDYSMNGFRTRC